MNEESKQGAPGGAFPVCEVCRRDLEKEPHDAFDSQCARDGVWWREEALSLANTVCDRERRRAESAEKELESCRSRLSTAEKERDEAEGIAAALGKQCAELERDRDYNAELRDDSIRMADAADAADAALEKALGALLAAGDVLKAAQGKLCEARCMRAYGEDGHPAFTSHIAECDDARIELRAISARLGTLSGGAHVDALKAQKEESK